jgi:HB1, ASXL, restriction endonuclease HTH domain
MQDLAWRDAIIRVLTDSAEELHYTEIADRIAEKGLRRDFGATPATFVTTAIYLSLKNDRDNSPFMRVGRGYY